MEKLQKLQVKLKMLSKVLSKAENFKQSKNIKQTADIK